MNNTILSFEEEFEFAKSIKFQEVIAFNRAMALDIFLVAPPQIKELKNEWDGIILDQLLEITYQVNIKGARITLFHAVNLCFGDHWCFGMRDKESWKYDSDIENYTNPYEEFKIYLIFLKENL